MFSIFIERTFVSGPNKGRREHLKIKAATYTKFKSFSDLVKFYSDSKHEIKGQDGHFFIIDEIEGGPDVKIY